MDFVTTVTSVRRAESSSENNIFYSRFRSPISNYYVRSKALSFLSFENGIATVMPEEGQSIQNFCRFISGCFDSQSNVESELQKVFGKTDKLKAVKFTYDDIPVFVIKGQSDYKTIITKWYTDKKYFELSDLI